MFTPIPTNHPLIFLHIPKTAGTTLQRILKRQYWPRHLYHVGSAADSIANFQQLPAAQRAPIRLLMGHFEMGIDASLPTPSTYFTILREPVARIISYYAHVRRDPDHYCHQLVNEQQMDLETFIRSGADVMVDNGQTRMIAGLLYDIPFGQCGPDVLALAKQNVAQRFACVGLTEQFDESLLLMQALFGWRMVYYASRNATPRKRNGITAVAHQAITQCNQLDLALYAFAQEQLAAQIAAQGAAFPQKLHRFQQRNRQLSPFVHLLDELLIRLFRT
ncbi:MAG: sulfotransferase family 2 domain-containing protein [Ardenticatenaceae bacterium]|nr:sulfotransferase family 2 domain-containing protein [Ardenticatenaceae bacterium]